MAEQVEAYNGLESFSESHKMLTRFYIAYLFLIPGISMAAHDITFGAGTGRWFFVFIILMIPIFTSAFPYVKMFIQGQDGKGLNMGTSSLTQKLGKHLGFAVIINIIIIALNVYA